MLRKLFGFRYGMKRVGNNIVALFFVLCAGIASADQKVIIGFGDSLTQGYGLPLEDGFVPNMQVWLADNGADVRMINAGVSGDTTAGGKARIDWTLAEQADAIVVALGGNDVLRGLPPAEARSNIDYILQAAQAKGLEILLVGMQAPGNYGPDYKRAFEALYPDLATKYGVALYPSFFAAFAGEGDVPGDLTGFVQSDGLHPSAEGVDRIVSHMGPHVLALVQD